MTDKQKTFFSSDEELTPIIPLTDEEAIALLHELASTARENTEYRRAQWTKLRDAGYSIEVKGSIGWRLLKPIWEGDIDPWRKEVNKGKS
jgi:hypothetical protein